MGSSLQEELLKAGLVSEDELRKTRAEARRTHRAERSKGKRAQAPPPPDPARARQIERDRELNRIREEERARRARQAQVRDFVAQHALNDPQGEVAYYFQSGRKIKRVYVTAEQHAGLTAGKLLVVVVDGKGRLVPAGLAPRIRALDPGARIVEPQAAGAPADADDPYADFKVPDDLMW